MTLVRNRWAIVAMGHFMILFLVSQLNHYMSVLGTQINVLGLVIAFSALALNYNQGILSLLPIAFLIDSDSPLRFGTTMVILAILFSLTSFIRGGMKRESLSVSLTIALALNICVFLAYTIATAKQIGPTQINYSLTIWNLLWSSAVIASLHRIYFSVQVETLAFVGIYLAEEQREAK